MNGPPMVVDASVAVKWLLPEPGRREAVELLDAWIGRTVELIAPPLVMMEVANALSKRCRQNFLNEAKARELFEVFESSAPTLVDSPSQVSVALALSLRHRISLWDSVYLAAALERNANLVTADARFHRAIYRHYPLVTMIAE
jgi:predicted nucleic acid-binding protein